MLVVIYPNQHEVVFVAQFASITSKWKGTFNQKSRMEPDFFPSAIDLNMLMVDVKASLNSTSKNTFGDGFETPIHLTCGGLSVECRDSLVCAESLIWFLRWQMWERNPLGRALYFNTHSIDSVYRTRGVMKTVIHSRRDMDPNITACLNPNSCSL